MSAEDPTGRRGRLSRSGRFLPLVKPATIAPPDGELDQEDEYAEISIERGPIVGMSTPVPAEPGGPDPDADEDEVADEVTPAR